MNWRRCRIFTWCTVAVVFYLLARVTTVGSCFLKVGAIAPPRALWLKFATDINSSTRRLPVLGQLLFYRDSGELEA